MNKLLRCGCLSLVFAVLCGQLLEAIKIADDWRNGFWRRPSVVWKTGGKWESHKIGRDDFVELPADCAVFFISIPDKYVRETNYFFRFKRSTLFEPRGHETYVICWVPADRTSPLWLKGPKGENPPRFFEGTRVDGLPSRAGRTTALSMWGLAVFRDGY